MIRMNNDNSKVFSLECPVCMQQFTAEGLRRAITPLCGHFVCAECNQGFRNQYGPNYQCPRCSHNNGSTREDCCGLNELIKDIHDCFSFGFTICERLCNKCNGLHAPILTNAHDLPGFRCAYKDCFTKFSTDSSSRSAPAFSICGHFVCVGCMEAYSAKVHQKGYRVQQHNCPKCSSSFSFREVEVSRGFISFIDEIKEKASLKGMKHCWESCRECDGEFISGEFKVCFKCDDLLQPDDPRPLCSECVLTGHRDHREEVIDLANIDRNFEFKFRVNQINKRCDKEIEREWKEKLATAFNSMSLDGGRNLKLMRKVETYMAKMNKMSTDYLKILKTFGDALFPSGNGARDDDDDDDDDDDEDEGEGEGEDEDENEHRTGDVQSPVENIPNLLPVEPMDAENDETDDNLNDDDW